MATIDAVPQQPALGRFGRRRPFSTWMKKLTNFKGSSSADPNHSSSKRNGYQTKSHSKRQGGLKSNSPYMTTVQTNDSSAAPVNGRHSFSTAPTGRTASTGSYSRSGRSCRSSVDGIASATAGNRSAAPTVSTDRIARSEAAQSHAASSGAGTAGTVGAGTMGRGADSTFSSPAPSVRSLTTTLTTIQSSAAGPTGAGTHSHGANNYSANTHSVQFSHQYPTSPPATALPAHLAPQGSGGHPPTYSMVTANNLLTDNASILTLASSSKRRRRRSMDTDASIRALAPSSLFGGSRESLPLSVLSANIDVATSASGMHQTRASGSGINERASIYSTTGVAPALTSERNSYYAGKQSAIGDNASVKSGRLGHGRNDSISGSIGGIATATSPLATPRELHPSTARVSRSDSTWGEGTDTIGEVDKVHEEN